MSETPGPNHVSQEHDELRAQAADPLGKKKQTRDSRTPVCRPRVGLSVVANDERLHARARALAAELELPLTPEGGAGFELLVVVTETGLELHETGRGGAGPIKVDFDHPRGVLHGRATASRREPLARAVGLKRRRPTVVDATAGLGRDAFQLAGLGCTVTVIERSLVLGAMLRDALDRAACSSITLIVGDAREVLVGMTADQAPEVVYLDPMFPQRKKSALAKKEMRILRRLVGDDPDCAVLLEVARRVARERVVVKRTPRAAPLAPEPSMSYRGKMARYDVYLTPPR